MRDISQPMRGSAKPATVREAATVYLQRGLSTDARIGEARDEASGKSPEPEQPLSTDARIGEARDALDCTDRVIRALASQPMRGSAKPATWPESIALIWALQTLNRCADR